jgi:large repetitive protein
MVIVAACVMLGVLTLTVGTGLMAGLVGGIAGAFSDSIAHITSQVPATAPPSGVTLDTPVLDAPANNGYTNQTAVTINGTVPGASVGKTDYTVHVYLVGKSGTLQGVAIVPVGGTTRFATPPIKLAEGSNTFTATLVTPSGEGAQSPTVTYILDTTAPKISIASPASGATVSTSTVTVSGSCEAGATITIRNEQAPGGALNSATVGSDGKFQLTVPVVAGPNTVDLWSTDQAGNSDSTSITIKRAYGQLAAHLAVSPSKFSSSSQTTLKLKVYATSFNGGPLAGATVTFTVAIDGLGPIVSPELTTDATGTVTWQVAISGEQAGIGQASVLVTSPAGDQVTATATITTT